MKRVTCILGALAAMAALSACEYKTQRTVNTPAPASSTTVVTQPSTVNCAHGYDESTNTCY